MLPKTHIHVSTHSTSEMLPVGTDSVDNEQRVTCTAFVSKYRRRQRCSPNMETGRPHNREKDHFGCGPDSQKEDNLAGIDAANDLEEDSCAVLTPFEPDFNVQFLKTRELNKDYLDSTDSGIFSLSSSHYVAEKLQNLNLSDENESFQALTSTKSDKNFASVDKQSNIDDGNTDTDIVSLVFSQDSDGDNYLMLSIIHGDVETASHIISMAPSLDYLNLQNNLSQTALHLAVILSSKQLVFELKQKGADLNYIDHRGDTPLHIACREGDRDVAQILLQYRPEDCRNQKSEKSTTNFLFSRNFDGFTCVHLAVLGLHLEILNFLLRAGADINASDGKCGRTVLHYVAESGEVKLLRLLLSMPSINVNSRAYNGQTPLALAHGRGFGAIVQALIQAGAVQNPTLVDIYDMDSEEEWEMGT